MVLRMSDLHFILTMAVLVIIALGPLLLNLWFFSGSQMSDFQIHDDCPDWFIERMNAKLDKILKERRRKDYGRRRVIDATLS